MFRFGKADLCSQQCCPRYPHRLCRGRIFESVCLFVRSITQKQIIPKCSNLV